MPRSTPRLRQFAVLGHPQAAGADDQAMAGTIVDLTSRRLSGPKLEVSARSSNVSAKLSADTLLVRRGSNKLNKNNKI